MADKKRKDKAEPLSAKDVKRVLFEREVSIAELARLATEQLGRRRDDPVTAWQMRAVIHRFPGVVYQEIREWLAGYLGCEVWQVGNEPARKPEVEEAAA